MSSLNFHERQHIQKLLLQNKAVNSIFNAFAREVGTHLQRWTETNNANVWVRNSACEKAIDRALIKLENDILTNIKTFTDDAWNRGNQKCDDLVRAYIKGMDIRESVKKGMFSRNMDALRTIQNGTVNGITVSERVWSVAEGAKTQLEFYLHSGISSGRPASGISSDVRQLLIEPDKRFRRVRNKEGKLILSKPMKEYKPGRGVYRSSYMNALRLTSTETNKSFRLSDYERWQDMDFVTGIEIKRSASNKGPCKICDEKIGIYPKTFKFEGFHPFCICYSVPIMMEHEEFAEMMLAG